MRSVSSLLCVAALVAACGGAAVARAAGGPDIRAYGTAPDWQLEITHRGNRLDFTLEGESHALRYAALGPTLYRDRKTTVYKTVLDSHSLDVFVKGMACRDSATGKSHEVTVIVSFDGKGYAGCGDVLTR